MKLIDDINGEVRDQPIYSGVHGIRIDRLELNKGDFETLLKESDETIRNVLTNLSCRFRYLPPSHVEKFDFSGATSSECAKYWNKKAKLAGVVGR